MLALDGLRGTAVLLVMASHFERFIPAQPWIMPFKTLMRYGWSGVDLFFALSGFLITTILLRTRGGDRYFTAFYTRRAIRIFPIYYATLIAVLVVTYIRPGLSDRVPPSWQWPFYFVYLANWIPSITGAWPPNVIGHFWSLAVEEQFYLIWPFIVLILTGRRLATFALILAAVALVTRCVAVLTHGPSVAIDLSTLTRCDSLALGSIGAIVFSNLRNEKRSKFGAIAVWSISLFCLVILVLGTEHRRVIFWSTAGFSILAIGFSSLVTHLALTDGQKTLAQDLFRTSALRTIGRYSYGMYVYHVPILGVCELFVFRRLPEALRDNVAFAFLYIVFLTMVTFTIAAVSYEVIERRLLALKRIVPAIAKGADYSLLPQTKR